MSRSKPKHPMQPLALDKHGVVRFHQNKIVNALVDMMAEHKYTLNEIWMGVCDGTYTKDDYDQLMQLIGYSVCGYCDLSSIPRKHKDAAWDLQESMAVERKTTKS